MRDKYIKKNYVFDLYYKLKHQISVDSFIPLIKRTQGNIVLR